ncbi:MAG TPA: imelysin family protein [Pseudomonadota bacterium]|jgi:iron uptake system EfeUOB component EfeO/EfeM|nr:imelysin family protein [Pseudomonadota bacterium]HNF98223.1 imelysin family protein [Pseudomonadota bacterium]HNI59683.1 imelysin family protein [Pseudomonadota bacterium]HNK47036.1 imelysin family protein [Pseudomonadota bacterium]HNN53485.1 imelysin family protein [Pseudomonadota bacterium]
MNVLRYLSSCVLCVGLWGCGTDNRLGRDAAATLLATTIRDYAARSADQVAKACLDLEWTLPLVGSQDVATAQTAWVRARLGYDHGAVLFKLVAPDLDALIDGEVDNPLSRTGLRKMEQPLFAKPTADALTLGYAAQALAAAAVRLPPAIDDAQRTVDVGSFLGALAGMSVVTGVKLDGSDSPFANQSLQSAQANLDGIAALYEPLSPLVHDVDAALDDEIHGLLAGLLGQLQGVTMTEQVKDKSLFLRRSAALGQAFLRVGPVLGQSVAAVVDVT